MQPNLNCVRSGYRWVVCRKVSNCSGDWIGMGEGSLCDLWDWHLDLVPLCLGLPVGAGPSLLTISLLLWLAVSFRPFCPVELFALGESALVVRSEGGVTSPEECVLGPHLVRARWLRWLGISATDSRRTPVEPSRRVSSKQTLLSVARSFSGKVNKYLKDTKDLHLVLYYDGCKFARWHTDAAFVVHHNCKNHSGGILMMHPEGRGMKFWVNGYICFKQGPPLV